MEVSIEKIEGKLSDFKLCKSCGVINWYENEVCHNCGKSKFKEFGKGIKKYIEDERSFYRNEGYTEKEIDNIFVNV